MIVLIVNVPNLDENAVLGDGGDLPVDILGDLPDPVPGVTDRRAGPLPRPARTQVPARVRMQQVGGHRRELELQTNHRRSFHNHGEGPNKGLLLVESLHEKILNQ